MNKFHFFHICNVFLAIGFLIITGCVSSDIPKVDYNEPTRINKIEYKADEIIVYMNREFTGAKPVLNPASKATILASNAAAYKMRPNADRECYEFYLQRKGSSSSWPDTLQPYSPKGPVTWGDWCFKNPSQAEHASLTERRKLLKRKLHNGTREENLYNTNVDNYSRACREPKPTIIPEPAPFCSNHELVEAKENSCYDPGFKRLCKYGLNELLNRQKDKEFSAGLSVYCLQEINEYRNRDTTLTDAFIAGAQSRILSELGDFGKAASFGIPVVKIWYCLNKLRNTCHPHAPTPPDCSRWKKFQSERDSTISENQSFVSELAEIEEKIIDLTTIYKTINY